MKTSEYYEKNSKLMKKSNVYDESYYINSITQDKKNEMIESLEGTIGYIK